MSVAVISVDYCAGILLDCGHKTFIRMSESPSRGDEVDCPTCPTEDTLRAEIQLLKDKLKEVTNGD